MLVDEINWLWLSSLDVVAMLMLSIVAMLVMLKTLQRDILKYNKLWNQLETHEEFLEEEKGWKPLYGDVFRPPSHAELLSVCVGTGVQILAMILVTMVFSMLGYLSPSKGGGLVKVMLLFYVCTGSLAGYASARLCKAFNRDDWKTTTLKTAFTIPAIVFGCFFVINAIVRVDDPSWRTVWLTRFSVFVFFWFTISVPLVFLGSYLGYKKPRAKDPVSTNKIPTQCAKQPWYTRTFFSLVVSAFTTSGFLGYAVPLWISFILHFSWQFNSLSGSIYLNFILHIVISVEISIIFCYIHLSKGDYHWWWRSFFTSGFSGFSVFLHSINYFFHLGIDSFTSVVLYFGYMGIISFCFFIVSGTVGFYACYWFVRVIYASVKIS